MVDLDTQLAEAIKTTHRELEAARVVVRELSNELADVIEVIEPALATHTARLRQARMASLEEMRLITAGLKELRMALVANETDVALKRAERFVVVCRDLDEFRRTGLLQALLSTIAVA